jgi:hypothetical protein
LPGLPGVWELKFKVNYHQARESIARLHR